MENKNRLNNEVFFQKKFLKLFDNINIFDFFVLQCICFIIAFHDYRILVIGSTLLALGTSFIKSLIEQKTIEKVSIRILVYKLIFIIFCSISVIWSVEPNESSSYLSTLVLRFMLFMTFIFYVDNTKKIKNVLIAIVLASLILCARIFIVVPITELGSSRIGSYLSHDADSSYGGTGITYALCFAIAYLCISLKNNKSKWFLKIVIISILTLVSFLSGSKKQVFLFLAVFLVIILMSRKSLKSFLPTLFIITFIIGLGYYLIYNVEFLYKSMGVRLESFFNFFDDSGQSDLSTIHRQQFLVDAYNTFLEHPFLGVGIDCFKYFNSVEFCWAENNYLELLADIGLVGTFIYYLPHLFVIISFFKTKLKSFDDYLAFLFFLTLILIDLTMVTFRDNTLQFYLSLLVSMRIVRFNENNISRRVSNEFFSIGDNSSI